MVSVSVPVHRLTVEDVYRMAEAGVLDEKDRVEPVVEVAQTSQVRDHEKARDYAAADVPEYWIVDLLARTVIVHRRPLAGAYQDIASFADGASIKPLLADAPAVDVSALLG